MANTQTSTPGGSATGGHDIIVVGASAGGVEALADLAGRLPAGLPAAVFVVLHVPPYGTSVLPGILSRRGPCPPSTPPMGTRSRTDASMSHRPTITCWSRTAASV